MAAVLVTAATSTCIGDAADNPVFALRPFVAGRAPLSASGDIALVSDRVACVVNSYESQVHCVDSQRRTVGVFGREGDGPGEFSGSPSVERGPDGKLAVFEVRSAQLTFFEPDGTLVSETRMPPDFFLTDLLAHRVLGIRLAMLDRTRSEDEPDYVPMEVDALSGEILWEREDILTAVGRDCFSGFMGILNPEGGLVTRACEHELVFLDHRDADSATVVAAPNYFEALPNERDVEAYVEGVTSIGGGRYRPTAAQMEAYSAGYREEPKRWFIGAFAFDDENRLWAATSLDRDAFSYIEIWMGTQYAGAVRIRDRLMGFDILGSTLVALVERKLDQYGVALRAIDWYDIGGLEFAVRDQG